MSSGIYEIKNVTNGKQYIGSAVNINRRWRNHLSALRRGTHINKHLQSAFNKYGEKAFKFVVLEAVLFPEGLIPLEQVYINELNPEYNISPTAGSNLGVKFSREAKRKMSEALKGKHLGKYFSEEHKRHMSEAMKGKPPWNKGKHLSEQTRKKMSEARKGKPRPHKGHSVSEATKLKMSEAHKGKHHSEQSKKINRTEILTKIHLSALI